jgi:Coenzyme PQQ synthesis protein D (PqqD)
MTALSPESVLSRNDRLSWRVLEGEAVVLFPDAGTLHRLNPTGTRCWELVDGTRSLAELGEDLSIEYSVAAEAIVADLQMLAAELVAVGLAEVRA